MNIIQPARLRAELLQGQRYTQHVHETSRPGQRAVRQIERWEREPRVLGEGGMGKVYLERCVYSDGGSVGMARAVKVMKKSKEVRYERELEAVILFSHEKYRRCFVESFGWYDTPEEVFIAMEYLPHGDLQQYLTSQNAKIPESEVKVIVVQILEGLQHMHDLGVTHRDIKPGNIMVVELGPTWWVKITDFGISKQCLDDLTALRTCAGTRNYITPEVLEHILRGERGEHTTFSYTNAVDVWALGMTAYVLLLGELPFKDSSFQRLRDYGSGKLEFPAEAMRENGLSADAYHFTKGLMAPRPGDRPNVAGCLSHHWLRQFCAPIEDISDALTQTFIDMDTQASRTWNSGPSIPTDLNQQETAILHGDTPSRSPLSSPSSQDSGIHMPFNTPRSTAHMIPPQRIVPPQRSGQEFSQQASRRPVRRAPGQPRASAYSQAGDSVKSCERPQSVGLKAPPVHKAPRATGWSMDKELEYHCGEIRALALSPDGTVLVSGGEDKVISVWDTKTWRQTGTLSGHTSTITDLAFCPSGKLVVSTSTDKTTRLWDVEKLESVIKLNCTAKVWAVAISPDGALLATGDSDGDVVVGAYQSEPTPARGERISDEKEIPLLKALRSVRCHKRVNTLAFSPDGQLLASAGKDPNLSSHFVKLWNPHTMSLVATLNHRSWTSPELKAVAFSRDGRVLASTSSDSVRLWDVATGMELMCYRDFEIQAFCPHFTFDGRLAFGTIFNLVVLDVQAPRGPPIKFGARVMSWNPGNGVAKVVGWPDGTLATAADTIKIWRPVTTVEQG